MKYTLGILIFIMISCQTKDSSIPAETIVDRAIEYSGKSKLNTHQLDFEFRDYLYESTPTCDGLKLKRISKTKPIEDVLYKGELTRYYKDSVVNLADTTAFAYFESVNSVHYFTQLPLRLKDEAVNLTKLGEEDIEGKAYHKLEVKFNQEGGGVDYEDVYIYWFDKEDYSMDYLAYSFLVNGGGTRFRKAINRREIQGVIFQDYENYKPKQKTKHVDSLGLFYNQGKLELLSTIENKNVSLKQVDLNCN
jgi:hypothetical protein